MVVTSVATHADPAPAVERGVQRLAVDARAAITRTSSRTVQPVRFRVGALALLVAGGYLAVTPDRMLWMSPTIDAATRAVLVGLLIVGPGITEFPLTALLYVGLIATFACFDGVLDVMEGLTLRNEFGRRGGAISLIVSGSILALLGGTLFATAPGIREVGLVLALLSATHAIASVPAMIHINELRRNPEST